MKQFIEKSFFFGFCVVAILALLAFTVPVKSDSYLCAYNAKCRLLEKTSSPRIIFVGGSNVAFGLDCKRMKDSLHVNVVNTGLHAGIGLKYMVDDIALYARKGDIIVFAPEYAHFYGSTMAGGPETIAGLMSVTGFKKAGLLNTAQWINVIKGLPSDVGTRIMPQKKSPRVYKASNFNEYGDEVKHWSLPNVPVGKPTRMKEAMNVTMSKYFVDRLRDMQMQCQVIVIPPAYRQTAYDFHNKEVQEVAAFLEHEGIPFAVSTQKCVLPDDCAYDSDYHINKKGVDRRTAMIIKLLKKYIVRSQS